MDVVASLRELMDYEARSCSMDNGASLRCMCIGCGEGSSH